MIKTTNMQVGLVQWQQGDGIGSQISSTLESLGHEAVKVSIDEKLPDSLDVVLAYGPFGSLVPVANQLQAYPPSQRPLFVLWMTEQFPNPELPEWVRSLGGNFRTQAERLAFRQSRPGEWEVNPRLRLLTTKAHRFRYYGDIFWLQRKGILSLLVIGSQWTVDFLLERGFDAMVGYYGYHPDLGADLQLERDIPVLWLGKIGTDRRGKLLQQLREDLKERGVEVLVIDGVENPYIFGKDRTVLLNRTKIVVNLLRAKWDNHSMRYYLASSNRALIVSEPTYRHIPFIPGKHLVEVPPEQMADSICYYLSHEDERRQIVDQAHQLVTTELTYEYAVHKIFERLTTMQRGEKSQMSTGITLNDLAYFGGTPAFQEKVHVGRPNIGNRERFLERVNDLLDRRWLTNNGPFVQELEQHIADKLGVKHCIAVCNGTVGLELAIRAAELKGEVIVPAMTFIATAHALKWLGIRPVFSDIDPRTHTLDPNRIEEMITPETTGILAVHLWGRPCGIEALEEIAQRHNLKLLFDAAHAFGCSYKGRMIGNFGDAEVFSFHATKFFNTLEGGAVVTNDDALARKIRLMKDFGFADWDSVISVGTNGKMNEVSAAMGLTLLENLDGFVEANRRNYHQYRRELADIPGVKMATYDESESCNYQYIVFDIDEVVTGVNRNQLMQILWAENVLARRYFHPGCHRAEPYRSLPPIAGQSLPETEKALAGLLVLPTGSTLGSDDISTICRIIRLVIAQAAEVQERWQTPVNMPVVAIAKAPVTL